MKVSLREHGGLAAGIARAPRTIDAAQLDAPAADELRRLVAAARANPGTAAPRPGPVRDAMSYAITVDDAGESVTLRQSDTDMSAAFADLLGWLRRPR